MARWRVAAAAAVALVALLALGADFSGDAGATHGGAVVTHTDYVDEALPTGSSATALPGGREERDLRLAGAGLAAVGALFAATIALARHHERRRGRLAKQLG